MKRSVIMISLAALILAGTASAAVKKGDFELSALGTWTHVAGADDGGDADVFAVAGAAGYFVTDQVQVGVGGLGAWISPDGGEDINVYAVALRGAYCFMTDRQWVPYVGGQIGFGKAEFGGDSANGTIYGGFVGVRYECTPVTDLLIEGQWNTTSGDLSDAVDSLYGIWAGFAHKWR
jgi:hypothetical protein